MANGPELTAFGRLLRRHRRQQQLSQGTLARRAGVSAGYIGLIETGDRGEHPSLEIVRRLAQALTLDLAQTEQFMRAAGLLGKHETLTWQDSPSFATVVANSKRLTKDQKELLIELYESWLGPGSSRESL